MATSDQAMLQVIKLLSSILTATAERNEAVFGSHWDTASSLSIFHGLARPAISVQCYLERIFKYANCSQACFVVAYIYLDRFVQRQPLIWINPYNVHRLLIAGVLVAAKFMDDIYYNNAFYARVGGITTAEMNLLELDFLFGIGFQLNVSTTTFHNYCTFLQRELLIQFPPLIRSPSPLTLNNVIVTNDQNLQPPAHRQNQQLTV